MTISARHKPYVWVTWITGVLAGEDQCQFAPWLQAHFKIDKVDRGFDLAGWKADHNLMVQARAAELRAAGWIVSVEDQNAFKKVGRTAILAGKADLVARRAGDGLIVDCKGGKPKDSDFWQVIVYLDMLPYMDAAAAALEPTLWRGEVCYRDHRITIEPEELNDSRRQRIYELMRTLGGDTRPPKVPSVRECAFCDVSKGDCPERMEAEEPLVMTSDF